MAESHDDVSQIQKRYTLTLINPSSFYTSLVFSIAVVSVLVAVSVFLYRESDDILFRLFLALGVLLATQVIDRLFIRNREYSKSLHMSLFGNALWLLTAFAGILAAMILSKPELSYFYITEGMFLFASFRIGVYTTTLGSSLRKAWLVCMLQPFALFAAMTPVDAWITLLSDPITIAVGAAFLGISSIWSKWTDRAGLPNVKSTHRLVQAYLTSMSKNDPTEVESIIEAESRPSTVYTTQIRFHTRDKDADFRLVLPDIHPGPFHPVGGSNIPYLIYKNLGSSAMVMHSVSDHSLNLPSKSQVQQYLESITTSEIIQDGTMCSEPVTIQVNKSRVVGLLFGRTAILFLSLSPHGMEDIPLHIKHEIEQISQNRNFERTLVVDCHNAMGDEISKEDSEDMLDAAKSVLDALKTKPTHRLEFGYANSRDMNLDAQDLAMGGIGVLCLRLGGKKYFLGWADANNMENGVREKVVSHLSQNGYNLLEICTSDTHYTTSGVRNRNGYYQFGIVSRSEDVAEWYLDAARRAEEKLESASFEVLSRESNVKVMGPSIYRDYSRAMDRSMKITKCVLAGCVGLFLLTMLR